MKFYFFAVILVGTMILLAALGYNLPVSGGLMKATGVLDSGSPDTSNFKGTNLWALIAGALVVTGGIVIGQFGRSADINFILAAPISFLAGAITTDYIALMTQLKSFGVTWISWTIGAFFTVMIIGFAVTVIEFFRGTD